MVKNQQTINIKAGAKIGKRFAIACRENYLNKVSENEISSENCPEMVVFNLQKLKAYLDEVEEALMKESIPAENIGVAVMPMIYANDEKFNVMFAPCYQDEQGNQIHALDKNIKVTASADDDWWSIIFNHGSGL